MLKIAITKGRLEKPILEIFEKANYNVDDVREKSRQLIFSNEEDGLEYYLSKAQDTITYVTHGVADIGIIGSDVIEEYGERSFYELLDLNIGKCRLSLAEREGANILKNPQNLTIATSFPNSTKKYFHQLGLDVEVIYIDGSAELTPLVGLADGIVDIVETGTTLKENGLVVVEDIQDVSTRLIVNKASFRTKSKEMQDLYFRLKKVVKNGL